MRSALPLACAGLKSKSGILLFNIKSLKKPPKGFQKQAFLPSLSQPEVRSLGILHAMMAAQTPAKRRLFDYRKLPTDPSHLDPLILYVMAHPEMKYTLILDAPMEDVNTFRGRLEQYAKTEYKQTLPSNFQLIHVESEKLISELQQLISGETTPAGFVTGDPVLAEIGYRKGLLRVFGFSDPLQQNAAVLLTADQLSKQLPDGMFFLPQRVDQLDPEHHWTELVAALEARQAFLAAA